MNELLEILIDVSVIIAAIWAAGKVIISAIERWKKLGILSDEVHQSITELERQLEAQWEKSDCMEAKLESRLDKAEQQIHYIAGFCKIDSSNIDEG